MGLLAKKACNGTIEIGAAPDNLEELRSWSYDEQAEENDFSTMGACTSTIAPGRITGRVEMTLYLADPSDAAQAALVAGAQGVAIVAYPFGKTSGRRSLTGTVDVLGRTESADVDGGVELVIAAASPGLLTPGVVA